MSIFHYKEVSLKSFSQREGIMLSEVSQLEKDNHHMVSHGSYVEFKK